MIEKSPENGQAGVEVSPEMIEAGISAYRDFLGDDWVDISLEGEAIKVAFLAMAAAAPCGTFVQRRKYRLRESQNPKTCGEDRPSGEACNHAQTARRLARIA